MKDRWGQEIKPGVVICHPTREGRGGIGDGIVKKINPQTLTVERAYWRSEWAINEEGRYVRTGQRELVTYTVLVRRPEWATVLPHIDPQQVLQPEDDGAY